MATDRWSTVDDYLAALPHDQRRALEDLRALIRQCDPDANEVVSFRIPAFRHHGMLVGFGAAKGHCSSYVMSSGLLPIIVDQLESLRLVRGHHPLSARPTAARNAGTRHRACPPAGERRPKPLNCACRAPTRTTPPGPAAASQRRGSGP